ncbi:hypothetical protein CEUSTIGMA_g8216.t1 [Chlamydomonas eustigma]|uniref:Uncharacterized protein n=1 Tax=Chlamydomonas eustigma TaxID=1157962 RepID=A0A250XDE3_9CHLO|nr:hypothetical protein CEUSTIGMA_g8216.t1 [Chlamydomonas eustigma]|eukprot:GAX80780.1 hypothetical protein CEUSTIGMA_g8216.t1 [Chlamydomonas eustigma]
MAQPQLVTSAAIITNAVKADTFIVQLITRQAYTLFKKNVLIRLRSWRQNLFHVTQSILVIFLVWCINKAVSYSNNQFTGKGAVRNPPVVGIPNIPDCRENLFLRRDLPCFTFLYTPAGDNLTEALVTHIRGNNDPPIPASLVMGLANTSQVDKYLLLHPQTVLAALHLQVTSNQTVSYILQTNSTAVYFKGQFQDPNLYIQLPLQARNHYGCFRHCFC